MIAASAIAKSPRWLEVRRERTCSPDPDGGRALTARILGNAARVAPPTASGHLGKLVGALGDTLLCRHVVLDEDAGQITADGEWSRSLPADRSSRT